jgi:hypothetical protein
LSSGSRLLVPGQRRELERALTLRGHSGRASIASLEVAVARLVADITSSAHSSVQFPE